MCSSLQTLSMDTLRIPNCSNKRLATVTMLSCCDSINDDKIRCKSINLFAPTGIIEYVFYNKIIFNILLY